MRMKLPVGGLYITYDDVSEESAEVNARFMSVMKASTILL